MGEELTRQRILARTWELSVGEQAPYSVILGENGLLLETSGCFESRWQFLDGAFKFYDTNGRLSCVLGRDVAGIHDDTLSFQGVGLLDGGRGLRKLVSRSPRVGCFLRTHFWDENVALAYEQLQTFWRGPLSLVSDQTRPFTIPDGISQVSHSLQRFKQMGLPLHPSPTQAMWFNGDYVFYDLALQTNFDHFLVIEFDVAVRRDLHAAVDKMISDGCDFVAPGIRPAWPGWEWAKNQVLWKQGQSERPGAENSGTQVVEQIYKSFFPVTFVSRRAALALYAQRLSDVSRLSQRSDKVWPFCEAFVPTVLSKMGLNFKDLSHYFPSGLELTVADAVTWREAMAANDKLIHPVLGGKRYVSKLFAHSEFRAAKDPLSQAAWLNEKLNELDDKESRDQLMQKIAELRR